MAICPVFIYKIYPAKPARTNSVKHKLVGCQSSGSSIYMTRRQVSIGHMHIYTHTHAHSKVCRTFVVRVIFRILLQILLLEAYVYIVRTTSVC